MQNNSIQRLIVISGCVVIVLMAAFFIYNSIVSPQRDSDDHVSQESVTVWLKWMHQTQFAGHYVADQKGFYAEQGIDITFEPFDFVNFPIEKVVNGEADFGVTGASELLIAREAGEPVVAIAVIYQENPVVAYALAESGIEKPIDMVGKRVGIQTGTNVETVIQATLANQQLTFDDVEVVPIEFDVQPVLDGEVDVATGYLTNEPIQLEGMGKRVNIINPVHYGVNRYADVLFTTEEMIETDPELVQRFVDATLQGWEYALENQDEAVNYTLLYEDPNNDTLYFEHQKRLLENSVPLIKPAPGISVGAMNFALWKKTHDLLRQGGIVKRDVDLTKAYTTEFLR